MGNRWLVIPQGPTLLRAERKGVSMEPSVSSLCHVVLDTANPLEATLARVWDQTPRTFLTSFKGSPPFSPHPSLVF